MMSHHFNSMLEHLRIGSLRKAKSTETENSETAESKRPPPEGEDPRHREAGIVENANAESGRRVSDLNRLPNGMILSEGGSPRTGSPRNSIPALDSEPYRNHTGIDVCPPLGSLKKSQACEPKYKQQEKKRLSICVPNGQIRSENSNGVTGSSMGGAGTIPIVTATSASPNSTGHHRSRELSPTPRNQQRKFSQDIRSRAGSFVNMDEDGRSALIRKPAKLKNVSTKAESYDTLHTKGRDVLQCARNTCLGSTVHFTVASAEPRKADAVLDHAKDFLDQYFTSIKRHASPAHEARWQQVQKEIESTGSYHLTETELIYGAKLAWRNSSRCIGRIQWSKLQVFDCRYVTTTSGMFEAICNHIKYATNRGNLRSAITIFPQRTDGRHDYRIWNSQLISYAGYRNPDGTILGDPLNVEFTEVCIKLGWKSKRTAWDILPLVVSANGHDPDYFDYPPELIVEVPLHHPTYQWFADMNLRWYALPAVSNMLFDCGGIQFTATSFSGWYMSTEIGCRNLCDTNRRNILEAVALKMDLDTRTPTSLWKDKALVEVNIAVLHSFQSKNVTIVDHHTASESFMKHFENESKLRNGCPADWIWIVPPLSSSITPVFHQEMALYYLKPSFEYQDPAWKTHVWKKGRDQGKSKKPRRKFHFKQIARAVKFTSKLFGRALSRRIKATVLYATETGKSEQYAKQLGELLGHAFNAQVYCMSDYDISSIEHEALLLVVASTFGNGDPPENGEVFAQDLYAIRLQESGENINGGNTSVTMGSSKSFMKANSRQDFSKIAFQQVKKIDRLDSLRGSTSETLTEETFGPLSNVRFAVFALGSSAYPNFCAFGKYVDNILGELGGERLLKLSFGDEMCGQEQAFRKWAPEVFKVACETFCLDPDETFSDASFALQNESLTLNTVRLISFKETAPIEQLLSKFHNKNVAKYHLKRKPVNLHGENSTARATIRVEIIAPGVNYEPGDHVGIFPANRKDIVDGILKRLTGVDDPDEISQLQILKETHTSNGIFKSWEPHEKIPTCSIRTLLTRFFDITTPPSRQLLTLFGTYCEDKVDAERINILVNESSAYEDWRHWKIPHLLDVLEEFPSCKPPASLLLAHLTPLQPRFYSISSSLKKYRDGVHLTVAVVKYKVEDGDGAEHFGVCSNYLEGLDEGEEIYMFIRSAPSFHMPNDNTKPVILIGPGTGIAPFRSFWQDWEMKALEESDNKRMPKVWLFFGCRTKELDLYREEKDNMVKVGILDRVFLALSREKDIPKTYVQDLAVRESEALYEIVVLEKGHVYVCGDVTMAEHVYQTIRKIIAKKEDKSEAEVEKYMLSMRDENRYHEDIFGITLRTAEIHNKSRATARIRMASQP
ncbi:nitric oxide synthase isoform X2 [Hermetia illucens]|uniref:nitric oxide synthase isoform X2 n=1 Tax=Hermetia illucens TaxID=343691 RepID=UPI0018CC1340|nr:nitric oxide synthase isoform X2 [Hermetia illucens]